MPKKITAITMANANTIRDDINAALATLSKIGLNVQLDGRMALDRNGRYASCKLSLTINAVDESGLQVSKDTLNYKKYADMLGMKKDWLGQSFTIGKYGKLTIAGLSSPRRKRPVLVIQDDTGKKLTTDAATVIRHMSAPPARRAASPAKTSKTTPPKVTRRPRVDPAMRADMKMMKSRTWA